MLLIFALVFMHSMLLLMTKHFGSPNAPYKFYVCGRVHGNL